MEDLSLHILDIVENSIMAKAKRIRIEIDDNELTDRLTLTIEDDGVGMDDETLKSVFDPFFTTKKVRNFGMGIPMLAQSAQECNGKIDIESQIGKGTKVKATFQRSHLDIKPLGDIGATMMTLIAGHPEIDYEFIYRNGDYTYELNTADLKREMDPEELVSPSTLLFIKRHINDAVRQQQIKSVRPFVSENV